MNMRKLALRWKTWRLKRKFFKENSWELSTELLESLVGIAVKKDFDDFRPTIARAIKLDLHYVKVGRLIDATVDAYQAIRDQEELTPDRTLYLQQPSTIILDDFLTSEKEIPITPSEILDELDQATRQLIAELAACKNIHEMKATYYQRKGTRIIADLVSTYGALIDLALSSND